MALVLMALLCITISDFFSPPKSTAAEPDAPTRSILIVVGAPGEEEYAKSFREWAERWRTICTSNSSKVEWIDGTKPS